MTPYEVLRIAKEASPDEIRVAFRRAASAAHIGTTRATTCRAEPRGSGEWVCDCTQMRPDCKPNAGVKVAPAPVDVRQLRRTLESVARCLERNDWGTAHDRVQDALALLPDGVIASDGGQS